MLLHQVVVFSHTEKEIASSSAHERVQSSPDYINRSLRASRRLDRLLSAMQHEDWGKMYQICFDEFMDMHHLFETSVPPFTYRSTACYALLKALQSYWKTAGDGPIITMDAGPTIHLLYRPDQAALAQQFKETILKHHEVL